MRAGVLPPLDALFPEPAPARDWLREELSRREYSPGPVERFFQWVQDLLNSVLEASSAVGRFNPFVAVLVLLVVVALAALVLSRLRANPTVAAGEGAVFTRARLAAADHRGLAQAALDRREWETVVVESTRALAAGLFERQLVPEETGATAHEIAGHAGRLFPWAEERLARAALAFDETLYGDHPADAERAHEAMALETELRVAEPASGARSTPVVAVPR